MNVPANTSLAGVLADVDEAARARRACGPNRLTLTLPSRVDLRHAEAGQIEPAAIVEVELLVLVHHRLRVERRAEIEPALRHAADDARLGGQRQVA